MAKIQEREKAIKLRKQGCTYSDIKKKLSVSKSTLSYWLSNYPLTKIQLERLELCIEKKRELQIERVRITKQHKREARLKKLYVEEKRRLLPLSNKELLIAGLFLYWGDGGKASTSSITIANTDPKFINFTIYWLTEILRVPRQKITLRLHLYSDMNIEKEHVFWSKKLRMPRAQFNKPYIKESIHKKITYKGRYGHGTCNVYTGSVELKGRIVMAIQAIADQYAEGL